MAVATEQEQDAARGEAQPDIAQLTERQLLGIDCARCGAYLGVHARELGEVTDHGYQLRLFGCDPKCPPVPLPHRQRFRAWPPGGTPRPTRPPP